MIFSWLKGKEGATAIEYSLIAAGVSLAIAVIVYTVGDDLLPIYQEVTDAFQTR